MSLLDKYNHKVKELGLQSDSLQLEAIDLLQAIINNLNSLKTNKLNFLSKRLYPEIKGLYMWGGVGRGKTFIMDIFFENASIKNKTRVHFVHFMQSMHFLLKKHSGKKNPIIVVAQEIARKYQLICFDEFFVEDIADAMVLGNVFKELFGLGVVLVATSNIQPQRLYANGLQRQSFIPAIDILVKNVNILNLDSGIDYRFTKKNTYSNYYFPCNEGSKNDFFERFARECITFDKNVEIEVANRRIYALAVAEKAICFDIVAICGYGRSASDYIEICRTYDCIYLCNLQAMCLGGAGNSNEFDDSMARRFIALVDECYDQSVLIVILANEDFKQIYQGSKLKFEIQRTISRLNDMQSNDFGKK